MVLNNFPDQEEGCTSQMIVLKGSVKKEIPIVSRGSYSLRLAVQLVMLIGADIWAVYRAEVLCVAAPHAQQPLRTMKSNHVELHKGTVWLMRQCQ